MPGVLIGRDGERAKLAAGIDRAASGPAAALIEGEAGMGKTELWRSAVGTARERGLHVLMARTAEAEAKLSYAAVGDLFEPDLDVIGAALPAPQRRALEVALLRTETGDEPSDRRAVGVAVLGGLRALGASETVVLAIDDVQWLDSDSETVLTFAVRRLTNERVFVLVARRATPGASPPLGLEDPLRVSLGPLGPRALHELLRDRLGLTLATPALTQLHGTAGGNPFYALELGRVLAEHGETPLGELPIPPTLRSVVADRLGGLSPAAREALVTAAALARPTRALVAVMSDGLDEAEAAGLVQIDGGAVRFTHPLFASVAYSDAPAPARRELHRRLAQMLDDPIERAAHLALGADGPDPATARSVAAAARQAAARGAPDQALELAEHARRLAPEQARDLAIEASDFAFAAGDTVRARSLLEAAGSDRPEVLVRLALLATFDGTMVEARDLAARALTARTDDPGDRIMVQRRLAVAHLLLAELAEAHRHAEAALALAETVGDSAEVARALANAAFVEFLRGDGRRVEERLDRSLQLERAPGPASIDDSPTAVAGVVAMCSGEHERSVVLLTAALRRAQDHGGDPLSTGVLFVLSELKSRMGHFDEALAIAERGLFASERTGQTTERALLLVTRALALAHLGRCDAARVDATAALAIAERAEQRFAIAQALWALGATEFSAGCWEPAWASLQRATALLRDHGVAELNAVPVHPLAAEAAIALGRLDDARRLLTEAAMAPARRPLVAAIHRGEGLLCGAAGEGDRAVALLETAVREHRDLALEFELARSLLALGSVQRRLKQRGAARAALGEAAAAFARVGAASWSERAQAEIARLGGRRVRSRDELTESELRIARLAAEGRSNREIAGELFIVERTVEANLTRVYRKLGVRSRAQLARLIADR
jgi:DNA-binding CsgD family transcriptional regulator